MKCPNCKKDVELTNKQIGADAQGAPIFNEYAVCRDCKKQWNLDKIREGKAASTPQKSDTPVKKVPADVKKVLPEVKKAQPEVKKPTSKVTTAKDVTAANTSMKASAASSSANAKTAITAPKSTIQTTTNQKKKDGYTGSNQANKTSTTRNNQTNKARQTNKPETVATEVERPVRKRPPARPGESSAARPVNTRPPADSNRTTAERPVARKRPSNNQTSETQGRPTNRPERRPTNRPSDERPVRRRPMYDEGEKLIQPASAKRPVADLKRRELSRGHFDAFDDIEEKEVNPKFVVMRIILGILGLIGFGYIIYHSITSGLGVGITDASSMTYIGLAICFFLSGLLLIALHKSNSIFAFLFSILLSLAGGGYAFWQRGDSRLLLFGSVAALALALVVFILALLTLTLREDHGDDDDYDDEDDDDFDDEFDDDFDDEDY